MILDPFGGPGGWAVGMRALGLREVGIEIDRSACATRAAAGHTTIRADVSMYPTRAFRDLVEGLIMSPPCQAWSSAGKRRGELDRGQCHGLADAMAEHLDGLYLYGLEWADPRSPLVCEPVRWVRDLRPRWVALEQVPPVLGLWQHFAAIFRRWGYSVWTGVLCAADYGVPQTRERAFLLAHRDRAALPPEPTHCRGGRPAGLLVPELLPWVSMAEALGWPLGLVETEDRSERADGREPVLRATDQPAPTLVANADRWLLHTNRGQPPDGNRQTVAVDRRAPAFTGKAGGQWEFVNGNQPRAARRGPDEPAPTIHFGHNLNEVKWIATRPATRIVAGFGRGRVAAPGHHGTSTYEQPEAVRVTVEEAAVLQGFRPDYPFQGTTTARFSQVGNAIPPPMATAIVGALTGRIGFDLEVSLKARGAKEVSA